MITLATVITNRRATKANIFTISNYIFYKKRTNLIKCHKSVSYLKKKRNSIKKHKIKYKKNMIRQVFILNVIITKFV